MMAYPLKAYFGRDTYANLAKCAICGKPYNEAERWHTIKSEAATADLWWVECDDCFQKPAYELSGDAECTKQA